MFAALNIICDSLTSTLLPSSGIWSSWIFMTAPITGIILGPYTGFLSVLIGVMVGHSIYFLGFEEFLFTLGAPIGAAVSSFMFNGKWKPVLTYYFILFAAYFATPVSWQLPFWGMWDVYLALSVLCAIVFVINFKREIWNTSSTKKLLYILALSVFVGLEADVLFRIFVLIPCHTYQFIYGWDVDFLRSIWALGAVETPIKASLSMLTTVIVVPSIIKAVQKIGKG